MYNDGKVQRFLRVRAQLLSLVDGFGKGLHF